MTTLNGTSGDDFIHPDDDGRIPPPGYNDITFTDNGSGYSIDAGAGTDIVYGGSGDDQFIVTTVSDISGLAEYYDGGAGLNIFLPKFTGFSDLTDVTFVNVASLAFFAAAELLMTADQINGFSREIAAISTSFESVIDLAGPGVVTLNGTYLTNLGVYPPCIGNRSALYDEA